MWRMTANILEPERNGKPTRLAHSHDYNEKRNPALPFKFRLLDDDREVYFEGLADDCDTEDAFAPLDHYGAAFGCTTIQYLRNGSWETL